MKSLMMQSTTDDSNVGQVTVRPLQDFESYRRMSKTNWLEKFFAQLAVGSPCWSVDKADLVNWNERLSNKIITATTILTNNNNNNNTNK